MKTEFLVALLLRFFVLYLALTHVFSSGVLVLSAVRADATTALTFLVPFLLMIVVLLLVWKHSIRVARRITPVETGEALKVSFTIEDLQILLFSLLGFWITLETALKLLNYAISSAFVDALRRVDFLPYVLRLAAGVWVMIGARGIANALRRVREW